MGAGVVKGTERGGRRGSKGERVPGQGVRAKVRCYRGQGQGDWRTGEGDGEGLEARVEECKGMR